MAPQASSSPLDILKKHWGYDSFRPLQSEIIQSVIDGHDTLGLLPTGGGKSITFQVPAIALGGLTVVITPLISLMKDQVDNLAAVSVKAAMLHMGMTRREQQLVYDKCRLGKVSLLYVSPERLSGETFIGFLKSFDVRLIVVDEAHCISQWGYDFRPSYLKIAAIRDLFPDAPVLALTASATPGVVDDICTRLKFRPGHNIFRKSFARENISYLVRFNDYKEATLLNILSHTSGSAIVYTRSRRRTAEIARFLQAEGFSADFYHAGLSVEEKNDRQNRWKDGRVRVIVATNAFGMGIDKPDVRVVVHCDIPPSLEEYYQEAGRVGRDGLPAFAVMIVATRDKALLSKRISDAFPPKDMIRRVYELIGAFLQVGLGEGYGHVFEFDLNKFCSTYALQPVITRSALTLLTRAGYIEFVEEVSSQARVMILANKQELYNLDVDDTTDKVLQCLLRNYTGLFADYVYISESLLASRAGVSPDQVYQSLLLLTRIHILHFIPRKSTPYISYPTSREATRYIEMPLSVYEEQKKRMENRVNAIKHYAFSVDECRVAHMLRYFGQNDAANCGKCDFCRSQKSPVLSDKQIDSMILYALDNKSPLSVDEIAKKIGVLPARIAERTRSLADDDLVKISAVLIYAK